MANTSDRVMPFWHDRGMVIMHNRANRPFSMAMYWNSVIREQSNDYNKIRWELTCGLNEGMDMYINSMPDVCTDIWPW